MSSERRGPIWCSAILALLAGAGGLGACADLSRGDPSPAVGADAGDAGSTSDGAPTLSFATDVLPLLGPCATCHVAGGQAGDTSLLFTSDPATSYTAVVRLVDTTSPGGSRLLSKASGNGHGGGAIYLPGSPQYQTILTWIQQGAPP
jgi:hypothetical protein